MAGGGKISKFLKNQDRSIIEEDEEFSEDEYFTEDEYDVISHGSIEDDQNPE